MKYASLVDIIRTAAEAALLTLSGTPGTFIHARKSDYSLQTEAPFPHINLFEPTDTSNNANLALKSYRCTFLFNRNEGDELDTSQRETILADMDTLSRRFFEEVDKNDMLEITGISREIVVRQYQARATGYAAQCTITGMLAYENCEPLPLPEVSLIATPLSATEVLLQWNMI